MTQSAGGGGGSGGLNVTGGFSYGGTGSGSVGVGLGGSGGGGGNGAVVVESQNGNVSTTGTNSSGVVTQSLGGGGGSGAINITGNVSLSKANSGAIGIGLGGSGGTGGYADDVSGTLVGNVTTKGDNSVGVLTQSAGGGGGAGGLNVSGALSFSGANSGSVAIGLGGSGGGGGTGAVVIASETGSISTSGINSSGIIAQSLGGGGGSGGLNISAGISGSSAGSGAISIGLGGSGGTGGSADDVTNISKGDITTLKDGSIGILTQSAGGGGGAGGLNVSGGFSYGGTASGAVSVGLGGSGGGGGDGAIVEASQTGNVSTNGKNSSGVIAQSMGGGGGAGGINISGGISISPTNSAAVTVGLGGSGGSGGNSDQVTNTVIGDVSTKNTNSIGVLAQSVGGGGGAGGLDVSGGISLSGGNSAAISVGLGGSGGSGGYSGDVINTVTGNISTTGNNSTGVLAQSLGGGGGAGGLNISGDVNVGKTDGIAVGVGLGGSGGGGGDAGKVTSTVTGTTVGGVAQGVSTTGTNSAAIVAQSVGGGGGTGALNVTGGINVTGGSAGSVSVGVGGSGGGGGSGKDVKLTVTETGTVETTGQNSDGLLAQSIGGGGGSGGMDVAGSIDIGLGFTGDTTTFAGAVGVGGFGGGGGNAGIVTLIYNAPHIDVTNGSGVAAESIGGGGGNGGMNVSGAISYGAGTNGKGYGLAVGVGGFGGDGGSASAVTVTLTGTGSKEITAGGVGSSGIVAMSVGGGGGNGGINVSGGIVGTAPLLVGIGGFGGGGGTGANVSVTGTTNITVNSGSDATTSDKAAGILAQSIGGGGGNGGLDVTSGIAISKAQGLPSVTVGVGGNGGDGAVSGTVTVNMTGTIATTGYGVEGINAQSIAGGGGNGGLNVSSEMNGAFGESTVAGGKTDLTIVAGVGGSGGTGTNAGQVYVTDTGEISTQGARATGLFAQSIGGGGGTGAMNITGVFTQKSAPIAVGVGGSGGVAGNGNFVDVVRGSLTVGAGSITTTGSNADGIEASSIGGGGGDAGMNFIVGFSKAGSGDQSGSVEGQFAIGGSGAVAGTGGNVSVINYSNITTVGNASKGILAQSIGGGGGNANLNIGVIYEGGATDSETKKNTNLGFNLAVGGGTGNGGFGGVVQVISVGDIKTGGDDADGIEAQSVGGGGGNAELSMAISAGGNGGKAGLSIGASGGTGGYGSDVTLSSTGAVTTTGARSYGLLAQSLGNGGGNSSATSFSAEGATTTPEKPPLSVAVVVGIAGGTGGRGGNVTITDSGSITTTGTNSTAIIAQSIGGGGGNGGSAIGTDLLSPTIGISVGGTGGQGGYGGIVLVSSSADISTKGTSAFGILAQSVGGGGGTGGLATAGGILPLGDQTGTSLTAAVGGGGGAGNYSSMVTVNNTGRITTTGTGAYGIMAQSVGGSGGISGMAITTRVGASTDSSGSVALTIGGLGGTGAESGTVNVSNSNQISTSGDNGIGIFAQAVGGGGGDSSAVINGNLSSGGGKGSLSVTLGRSGGSGGSGGEVNVTNTLGASITTTGTGAIGILAMSIGGGGGSGSTAVNAQVNIASGAKTPTQSVAFVMGGSGGDGGNGGNVNVNNSGTITTMKDNAAGIVALSVGGGGGNGGVSITGNLSLANFSEVGKQTAVGFALGGQGGDGNTSGTVTVLNSGTISTSGNAANGIFAESVGGGGGNGGVAVALSNNVVQNPISVTTQLSNIALGGFGGTGGDSGDVIVLSTGRINLAGDNSYGIYAQSVSGGGGTGAYSISAPAAMVISDGIFLTGLGGGSTGKAGNVYVSSEGGISTTGKNDTAVFQQSVSGGGGNISTYLDFSKQSVALGDDGNQLPNNGGIAENAKAFILKTLNLGSNNRGAVLTGQGYVAPDNAGGAITSTTSGSITTTGTDSMGSVIQSIGGGGGNATEFITDDVLGTVDGTYVLGETGTNSNTGDNGGDVTSTRTGTVSTTGDDSGGSEIQSIGGGGGNVVSVITTLPNDAFPTPTGSNTAAVTLGADGGTANEGGTINITYTDGTSTGGDRSYGVLVQTIGAGGGTVDLVGYNNLQVTLGGTNSASGDGGDISMTNTGAITTTGTRSDAVILQSIGGGGGLVLTDLAPGDVTYSLSGTNSGNGGNINFTQIGDISVHGEDSIGILAQSLGGGGGIVDRNFMGSAGGAGTSGTINLTITGSVVADGINGIGVFAQSQAKDGQGDITISLDAGKTISGGSTNGVGVELSGGANNTFTNNGSVNETDTYGTAIIATDGNDTVKNYGIIRGSMDLGTGSNVYNNEVGSLLESGTFVNLATNGTFYNAGTISEGGFGHIQVTNVTGSYVQTGAAVWYNDLSPIFNTPGSNDQFNISGDAKLGNYSNTVNLNQVYGVATTAGTYTLITSDTDLVGSFQFGTMTGFTMPNGLTYTFHYIDPAELLQLLPSQGPFYWDGAISSVWNTDFVDGITNWSTDATGTSYIYGTPGVLSDVYFASSLSSTINLVSLGENYSVNSLTSVAGASDVTIVGSVTMAGTQTIISPQTLTIAGAQGAGITLQNGAPTTTLFVNIELAGDQAWTNDSTNPLNISGTTVMSAGNHTLTVQGTGTTNLYSKIATGSGGLIKDGTGLAILYNQVNTYSGGTTIKGGILAVDTAGALGLGDVTNISGTLQTTENLGGVARTIYVANNFSQKAGGTLLLQVVSSPSPEPSFDTGAPGTNYENVQVAGNAQLGGTLDLNFAPSTVVTPGQHYVVLTAGAPVTGHFIISTTTNLPDPYYTITTGNDTFNGTLPENSAVVTLLKPFTSFTGLNPNQNAVAEAIDKDLMDLNNNGYFALPNGTLAGDFFDNIVMGLNASIPQDGQLARTLDELSPQRLELFRTISFNNSSFFSQQITNHTANERAGFNGLDTSGFGFNDSTLGSLSQVKTRLMAWQPTPTPGLLSDSSVPLFDSLTFNNSSTPAHPWNTFIAGNVVLADVNSNANVTGANYTTGAVTAGADYHLSKNWTVGALFGYSHTDASLDGEGSTATIDSYTPGVYASYADQGWYANGLFTYTYNAYTENRDIMFPGVSRTATGSPMGNQYSTDLSGGYEFHVGHLTVGPSLGLDYVHLDIHSFAENGAGAANLNIQEQTADSLRSRLGFETRYKLKYMKTDYMYHLGAYWQHEFMGNSTGISSSFQVPTSTPFTVYGPGPDRNTLLLDAGGDVQVLNNMDVFFDYTVQTSQSQYFGQSIQAGVKVGF